MNMVGRDCEDIIYKYVHNLHMADMIKEMNEYEEKNKRVIWYVELENPKKLMKKLEKFTPMEVIILYWNVIETNRKYTKLSISSPKVKCESGKQTLDAEEMIKWIKSVYRWASPPYGPLARFNILSPYRMRNFITVFHDRSTWVPWKDDTDMIKNYERIRKHPFVKIKRKRKTCAIQ